MRIGWIGTGVMGGSMAGHLLDRGMDVVVTTRTRARAEPLLAAGATWAESPAAAADGADAVVSIVGYPDEVEAVHLGDEGTLSAADVPPLIIDCTTSDPSLAERIAAEAATRGARSLDAPVSGGDVGARGGTLSVMVGGDPDAFERARPIFEAFGDVVVHQGPAGAGQRTKAVNQILVAAATISTCEALVFAVKSGLDPRTVLASVSKGAAGSWTLTNLAPRMLDRDFDPGFKIEHFVKDLGIAVAEADRLGLSLPGLRLARRLYEGAAEAGHGERGTHGILLALEEEVGL